MIFSPPFFNIMTHLLVHLVKEIGILGPVFLHNMIPFERYFAVLKEYSLHSVLIDIFTYDTMTKGTTSVLINLINVTYFFVGPPMF